MRFHENTIIMKKFNHFSDIVFRLRLPRALVLGGILLFVSATSALGQTANFSASPLTVCSGFTVTFTNLSSGFSGSETYLWDFGTGADPATSTLQIPGPVTYTYNESDPTPTITLIVTDGSTYTKSEADYVTVNPLPATPTITADGPLSFCIGGSVTLTSSTGSSYLWSTGATSSSIVVSSSGSYTVQVTDGTGCTSLASSATVVTVNPLPATPTITADGPLSFCIGGSVTLTSSTGSSYLWSTGATSSSIVVSSSGSYTVQVTDGTGCTSLASSATVVTVNPLPATPTITADGPLSFCIGGSVTLTSSTGSSYLWSTGATSSSIVVSSSGSYTVQVTDGTGCTSLASSATVVTVNPLPATPTITADGPLSFCIGGSVTLTSSTGSSYLWSTGATSSSIVVSSSGSYTVQVTDGTGCTSLASSATVVTVNPLPATPTITADGPLSFCIGGSVTLTSSTGSSYLWSTGATSSSIVVSSSGSYTVQVTDGTGCTSLASSATVVTVNPLPATPTITADGPLSFCIGGSVTLTSSTGSSYLWSTGATSSSIVVSSSGSYTVQVTDGTGCTSLASSATVVTVNPLPATPTITADGPLSFCIGGSVTLTSSTGSSYLWSTGATSSSIVVSSSGSYTVQVTDGTGCTSLASSATVVTVNPLPATPTITADGPLSFCIGGSVTLTSSTGSSYLWSTGATSSSIVVSSSGSYTVQVTDGTGCTSLASSATVVTVNPLPATPTITADGPLSFCIGGSVTLTSSTGSSYLWSTGATSSSIVVSSSGSYTVQVTDGTGCTSLASSATVVTVNPLPATPTITADGPLSFCIGGSVTLTSSTGSSYLWSTGATSSSIVVSSSGSYTVQVTDGTGCTSLASSATVVTVNPLPATPTITADGPLSFCIGGSVTLTSSTGSSYLWSTGATSSSIVVSSSGSYTVQVTDGTGCTSLASSATVVTVNPLPATPTITADGPLSFCIGGSVTLTSSTGSSYLWSTGATSSSIVVSSSGSYTVQVTDGTGCTSLASSATVVTVNPLPATPTITADGPLSFCIGGSVTLTSSTGSSYLWSTGATSSSIVVSSSGSYTVQVTDGTGCTSLPSSATVVTVNPLPATPTITADGPLSFCIGGSVTLTSSTGSSYLWSTGATSSSIVVSSSGSYTVQVTDGTGCTSLASSATVVTVNPLPATPTITADGPLSFCIGGSVTLTSSTGSSYLWSTGATSSSIVVSSSGSYTVQVTDGTGCTSLASSATVVTVNPLPATPTITADGPLSFCIGGSVTLTSSTGSSYLWSTGATSSSIVVSSSGSYTVQVTDGTGCTSLPSSATVVTVNPLPATPTITADGPLSFCIGGSVTLTSSTGSSYLWSTGATSSSIVVSSSGSYTVQVTDGTGCTSLPSSATVVTVNPLPIVNAGTNASILNGTNTTLQGTVTGEGTFTFIWTPSDRVISPATITTQTTNLNLSTIFTLTATSQTTGCSASANVTVTVTGNALSVLAEASDNLTCSGESVQLTAIASGGSGIYTYSWTSDPIGFTSELLNPSVTPAITTTYFVTINDSYNSIVGQTTIVVNPLPLANAGANRSIFQGQNTQLGAISNAGSTYSWTSYPVGFTSTEANPTVIPTVTTIYTLTETITSTGCTNNHNVTVTVNSLPASFIPVWWPGNGVDHMNFYVSTATLDNVDLQPGDIIGVFDGNLCVGVGVLTEVLIGSNLLPIVVSRDDSYTPATDGYTLGNIASYRIWDVGDNREYYYTDATYISGNNVFAVGATTSLSLEGVRPVSQTITLLSGWNILSFTVAPDNPSMLSVVQPLIDNGTLVKVQNEAGTALEFLASSWYNFIGNMMITEGYKVRVSTATSLNITGRPVRSLLSIPLSIGWNIISYPFVNSQPAMDVFDPLINAGTLVKVQNEAGSALEFLTGYGWLDNIHTILPGEGYKVRTNSNTTLSLSDDMGGGLKNSFTVAQPTHFKPVYIGNGLDHMNIYFLRSIVEDDGLILGDEVGVFDGDLCIGYGIVENPDQQYLSLVASFDDPATPQQDGFVEGHPISLKIWSQRSGLELKVNDLLPVKGSSKYYFRNGSSILSGSFSFSTGNYLGEAYPNPSANQTTFIFKLAENNQVRLEIINSSGIVVRTLVNEECPAGLNTVEWDNCVTSGNRLKPGLYFYRFVTSDYSTTKPLVIQE